MLEQIQAALENDGEGLLVHYQPIVNFTERDRPIKMYEALIRFQDGDRVVKASDFILQVLREPETCIKLDHWVLNAVAKQTREDRDTSIQYSVNVTAATLSDQKFPEQIQELFGARAKDRLIIELIEKQELSSVAITTVKALQQICSVFLDDVGEEFSNLKAIVNIPVNGLKIHGSYVSQVLESIKRRAVLRALFSICEELGLKCVCECVQTEAMIAGLATVAERYPSLNLYLQGYIIGRPAPL